MNLLFQSKKTLMKSSALVHFDPKLPLVVVADNSVCVTGAVLCYLTDGVERSICFASHTLKSAKRNYSQLEKEALAIVFALRKFDYYLRSQSNFTAVTDHKTLLGIFSPCKSIPPMSSGRIQLQALLLQAYNSTLRHCSRALLGTANAISHLTVTMNATDDTHKPADWTFLVNFLVFSHD